jgi:hypothetical protein
VIISSKESDIMWKETKLKIDHGEWFQTISRELKPGDKVNLIDLGDSRSLIEKARDFITWNKPVVKEAPVTVTIIDDDVALLVIQPGSETIYVGALEEDGITIIKPDHLKRQTRRNVRKLSISGIGNGATRVLWFLNETQ